MSSLRDLAIRRKLGLLIVITTAGAILMAAISTGVYGRYALRKISANELGVVSDILANNITAAVAFGDQLAAEKIIDGVEAKPSIVAAMVFTSEGEQFASYVRDGFEGHVSIGEETKKGVVGGQVMFGYLLHSSPIEVGGRKLGTLTIQADFSELNEFFYYSGQILMGIALFSCIAAVLLSSKLQGGMVEPILALARVTKRISLEQDFSVRAPKYNHDEIGDLVDSFNHMVGEIEQASSALRESEERYQTLAEASPVGLLRFDTHGEIAYMNERSAQISGLSLEEFQLKGPLTGLHPEDRARVFHLWQEASQNELPLREEYRYLHEDGEVAWVLAQAKPEFDDRGSFLGYIGTLTDLTDRKRAEEERETLIGELEVRNAEMEQFTYTVSHDLKSPLITIRGFLGLLQKDIEVSNEGRIEADIQHIENAVEKMGFLLEDLLALSRVGRIVNPSEKVSLFKLVNDVVRLLSGIIDKRGVQIKVDPNLPVAFVDHARFEQVIQNLIENAIKFMGDQKSPCVEISVRDDQGKQVCFVRDNGIGIDPRYHDTVFGLFDRLNQTIDGTGIGLALVKRIIEVHDGEIWVESEGEGYGSSLCFTIPVVDEVDEEERAKNG